MIYALTHMHYFPIYTVTPFPANNEQAKYYSSNFKEFIGNNGEDSFNMYIRQIKNQTFIKAATAVQNVFIVGCNTGQEITLMKMIYKQSMIHCFEPLLQNLDKLYGSFLDDDRVKIIPTGVSNFNGHATFIGSGQTAIMQKNTNVTIIGKDSIQISTLDAYNKKLNLKGTAVVHVDVEGGEFLVFLGGFDLLKKTSTIIYECADFYGKEAEYNVAKKVEFLDKMGFTSYKLGSKTVLRLSGEFWNSIYDKKNAWSNCLAVKTGSELHHDIESNIVFPKMYTM